MPPLQRRAFVPEPEGSRPLAGLQAALAILIAALVSALAEYPQDTQENEL